MIADVTTPEPPPERRGARRRRYGAVEVGLQALRCAAQTVVLLVSGRLHLRIRRVGTDVALPDGRHYTVFRHSTCDGEVGPAQVTLAVWFHLRGVPAGAQVRRTLFEHLCVLNTVLFAGFEGYRVKLWMVDPVTSDYAGLYSWASAPEAETYARCITAILGPLSRPGSVGFQILADTALNDYLAT